MMKTSVQETTYQGFLTFATHSERSVKSLPYWYLTPTEPEIEPLKTRPVPVALRQYLADYAVDVGMPPTAGNRERMIGVVRSVARATKPDSATLESAILATAAARLPLTATTLRSALLTLGVA